MGPFALRWVNKNAYLVLGPQSPCGRRTKFVKVCSSGTRKMCLACGVREHFGSWQHADYKCQLSPGLHVQSPTCTELDRCGFPSRAFKVHLKGLIEAYRGLQCLVGPYGPLWPYGPWAHWPIGRQSQFFLRLELIY